MAKGQEYGLIVIIILGLLATDAESVGTLRLCGRELADAVALVCHARGGYNHAFSGVGRGGRFKRGIVDECCRGGCSLSTLESYCSEPRNSRKDTLQISKRSELSSSETRTTTHLAKNQEDRTLNNFVIATKNRKLRPLALLYSERQQDNQNINMNLIKNNNKKYLEKENQETEPIWSGYNESNEPLDTEEIMAEVVESSLEPFHPKKTKYKRTN